MSGYVSVNRISLVQLHSEERKHQAHLKKIADMKRRGGIDSSPPTSFPHVKRSYVTQAKQKNKQIMTENDTKSKRILNIMQPKTSQSELPLLSHPSNLNLYRRPSLQLSQSTDNYSERISKIKGTYNARDWEKDFEEHKQHLRIIKDNKLFTPPDIAAHLRRLRTNSISNSKRTTPASLTHNLGHKFDNNN